MGCMISSPVVHVNIFGIRKENERGAMKKIDWMKAVKKLFGNEKFTIDMLAEKEKASREKTSKAVWYHTERGNIENLGDGTYRATGKGEKKKLPRGHRIVNFLKAISEKFGDEEFTVNQAMEASGKNRRFVQNKLYILAKEKKVKRITVGVYKVEDIGHNSVAGEFKKDYEEAKKAKPPECLPSCILTKMESVLGKEAMKDWVYATVMVREECVGVLEEEAVRSIVKN